MPVGRPRTDRQLAHCREEGLSCHECVRNSATSLVQIAERLNGSLARRLFTTMYPESACHAMAGAFVQIIAQESRLKVRKPIFVEPLYQAAVA